MANQNTTPKAIPLLFPYKNHTPHNSYENNFFTDKKS